MPSRPQSHQAPPSGAFLILRPGHQYRLETPPPMRGDHQSGLVPGNPNGSRMDEGTSHDSLSKPVAEEEGRITMEVNEATR